MQVAKPSEWEDICAFEIKTFTKTREKMEEGEWFYEGEMKQKHGEEEWAQFKAMGKFDTQEDEDGITRYRKIRMIERKAKTMSDQAEVSKKTSVLQLGEAQALEDAMANQFDRSRMIGAGRGNAGRTPRGSSGSGGGAGRGAGRGTGSGSNLSPDPEEKSKANAKKMMALLYKKANGLAAMQPRLMKKSIALAADKTLTKVESTKNKIKEKYDKSPYNHSSVNAAVAGAAGVVEEASKIIKAGCAK